MEFEDLKNKTLVEIKIIEDESIIRIKDNEGHEYEMYHSQDCCESVHIDDICGDLDDLIGVPILLAEEVSTSDENSEEFLRGTENIEVEPCGSTESYTWTFYKLATIKGYVTIRWYGSSNGYYSEGVDFEKVV